MREHLGIISMTSELYVKHYLVRNLSLALIGSFFIGVVICSYFVERIGGSAALLISVTFLLARLFVDGWLSGGLASE